MKNTNYKMEVPSEYTALRPCPVCGSIKGDRMCRIQYALFDDLNIPGLKTLVQCGCCGLLYDDTPLTADDLTRYYTHNRHYEFVHTGKLSDITSENMDRLDRITDLIVLHSKPPYRILDIGCNTGNLLDRCRERGIREVAGIELSEKSREAAIQKGLHVVGTLEDLDGFIPDIVILSDVMEHLLQPGEMLKNLTCYAPGALVYLEVPAAEGYILSNPIQWDRFYFEHINHYTKASLRQLCSACGITIIAGGTTLYSRALPIQCLWLVGKLPLTTPNSPVQHNLDESYYSPLPHPGIDLVSKIPAGTRPLAMWGISQYAMLLLGSQPGIAGRIQRLFDASPAKIGRTIGGVRIEHPSAISTLTRDYILVIPKSYYLDQMLSLLPGTGFQGLVVQV